MACCESVAATSVDRCPSCGSPGRGIETLTVKSSLHARALERIERGRYRFCMRPGCDIVYFKDGLAFTRGDLRVPVFVKEPAGRRLVCYCFEIDESAIDGESEGWIRAQVALGRCACEIRNPEGRCCLGNVSALRRSREAEA